MSPVPIIDAKSWETFLEDFRAEWKPGQHIAIIAPTGQGKTTVLVTLLDLRHYVLAFDPKGGDDTLAASGFQRVPQWPPPPQVWDDIADGKPARLIIGAKGATPSQLEPEFRKALDGAMKGGGWTVYVDELQVAADRRMMRLDGEIEKMLVSARFKKVSVVTSFQAPSWVPSAATRQARWIVVWPTRDEDCIKRIAEKAGRQRQVVAHIVHRLPPYHALVIPPKPRDPMIIVHAPAVN